MGGYDIGKAMELAIYYNKPDMVQLLLDRGADVESALLFSNGVGRPDIEALLAAHSRAGCKRNYELGRRDSWYLSAIFMNVSNHIQIISRSC